MAATRTAAAPTATPEEMVGADAVERVASELVASGRVVPGLTVEAGEARSWWWPLPSAGQRAAIAALVTEPSPDTQRSVADALAVAVDAAVRSQLTAAGVELAARRPGRPTAVAAWLRSLTGADPRLPASLDPAKVRALAEAVQAWVRSGTHLGGRARLCLRVHEPARQGADWRVELLVQDRQETSLLAPLPAVLDHGGPFGAAVVWDVVGSIGRLPRLAPELAGALEEAAPSEIPLGDADALRLLRERAAALDDAGIALLVPAWWSNRPRLGLRARATRSSSTSSTSAGLGMDALVDLDWEVALGATRLTKRDLETLRRAAEAKRSLVRIRGQWVEIDPAEVVELIEAAGTGGVTTAGELLRAGLGVGELDAPGDAAVVGVDARAVPWLASLLDDALHATVEPLATPAGFGGTLRPYQERGAGWLTFLGRIGLGACLADDMGLGKTAQLIATLVAERAHGDNGVAGAARPAPTLVVCPVSVLGNWQRELARFAPELGVLVHHGPDRHGEAAPFAARARDADVILTTYSLVARDAEHLAEVEWGRLVLDEAQQIKNPSTAQARAVHRFQAHRRVALTGTPVENRLTELWSIMHALNPGLLGSARSFRERFALPIERDGDEEATALLRRITGPFVLRRLKTDRSIIGDLPDKIETRDRCPLTREQATLYQAVVDDLLAGADEEEGMSRRGLVLAGLLRLKQVCNHPAHFLDDGSPLRGRSGKLTRIEELLDEILAEGDKVLCFTQFAAWGDRLGPYLAQRFGTEALWLHGGVRRKLRDEMVARFAEPDGPRLFLVSLKAGGTGLNLTAANHVIHLDRWWNPAVEDQATDRAHRIGQRRTVQVHKLVTAGTVEERIDEMIDAKRALAERVVGTGEEWLTELSTDQLRELVALRPDEAVG